MEVNPIREIRAPVAVSTSKADSEVQPPFAFDPAARMEDDAYRENDRAPGSGLEEEEPETAEELEESDEQSSSLSDGSDSKTKVSYFA
jgi:hypothetical protein